MKVLFIGGSGTISTECVKAAVAFGHEVCVLNRGSKNDTLPPDVIQITCNVRDSESAAKATHAHKFDCVADFISFTTEHLQKNINVFRGKTAQYLFISSASAYQKPPRNWPITESTPLCNPHWQYSRDKIACEELLMREYRENGLPFTVVRPSHTYCDGNIPLAIHGSKGPWQTLKRILEGKPVPMFGDGTSLWTVTHSSDFAQAFVHLLGNRKAIGEAFHITSDEAITWNQIYGSVARALGMDFSDLKLVYKSSNDLIKLGKEYGYDFEGPLLGDKSHCAVFDNTKIKRFAPGWFQQVTFETGIASSVAYTLERAELQSEDPTWDALCERVCGCE
ncbi:MAG: SDR family oxidoreductase [Oscillospiraceae bacterium]|jgi:nucleoside-diphosphate-sugar epimerase|nr:SDR family oxidoreductase [Oscillospiraceae bacterium]